jgi:hypothetical protein
MTLIAYGSELGFVGEAPHSSFLPRKAGGAKTTEALRDQFFGFPTTLSAP